MAWVFSPLACMYEVWKEFLVSPLQLGLALIIADIWGSKPGNGSPVPVSLRPSYSPITLPFNEEPS